MGIGMGGKGKGKGSGWRKSGRSGCKERQRAKEAERGRRMDGYRPECPTARVLLTVSNEWYVCVGDRNEGRETEKPEASDANQRTEPRERMVKG